MLTLCSLQSQLYIVVNASHQEYQIEQARIPTPPERWLYCDDKFGLIIRPYTIVVGGLYTEGIGACGQIGIGGAILVAHIVPIAVEPFEHVGILYLFGRTITERSIRQRYHLRIAITNGNLLGLCQVDGMSFGISLLTIQNLERGNVNRRHHAVGFYLVGIKAVKASSTTKINTSILGFNTGIRLELLANQTVVAGKALGMWLCRLVSYDTPFG